VLDDGDTANDASPSTGDDQDFTGQLHLLGA
jgi:hypothetical protein